MQTVMMLKNISMRAGIARGGLAAIATLMLATPALAHHPFGGEAPKNVFQGLLSGVGHPIIGLDHFAFVIAVGLLAAVLRRGITVPISFLLAALAGTGLHLAGLNLPASELVISASVLLFGILAVTHRRLNMLAAIALTALAGIFHGYAYGEAIIGAEPMPIVAYLVGFTVIQGAIAYAAYGLSLRALNQNPAAGMTSLRQAGFVICGAGAAFLGSLLV
ncbi:MAG: HupE/UreJ family protein [Phormidesmis sp.]